MKQNGKKSLLVLLLAMLLMFCMLTACFEGENGTTGTTDTSGTTGTTETTDTSSDSGNQDPEPPEADTKITVVNGTVNNATSAMVSQGDVVTLVAATPAKGYFFAFWEDADGNVVGTTTSIQVTVDKEQTYKAYYEVAFGETVGTQIKADLEKDWMQGATNGSFNGWSLNNTRVTFKEPYLLKAGETIHISHPNGVCPRNPGDCPSIDGTGDCKITCALVILTKNANSNTGDITQDYTLVKGNWNKTSYTATEDTYVIFVLKWDKHGSDPFTLDNEYMKEVVVKVVGADEGGSSLLGDYWKAEVNDAIAKAESHAGEGVSSFFYLTDSHWPGNAGYSPALINYMAEKLNSYFVHFNGDIIQKYNPVKQDAIDLEINGFYGALENYTKTGEKLKIMTSLGNHDRNGSSNCPDVNLRLTEQEAYDIYFKRMEGWGVTVEGNPNCSYYDDTENKVRYVQFYFAGSQWGMIEDGYVDAALTWAEEQIKALSADWTVVLFTHGFMEETAKTTEVAKRILKLQGEAEAEIAVWMTGHYHYEQNSIIYDDAGNKVRVLKINADAINYTADYKMTVGTATEQCFLYVQVDTKNEMIYLTRVGAGEDKAFTYGSKMANEEGTLNYGSKAFVKVVNGLTHEGKSTIEINPNTKITITAETAPSGYAFSHWVNKAGETVGNTATLIVTVSGTDTFRAVYTDTDPSNDTPKANQVLGGGPNDWQQGSFDGKFNKWDEGLRHTRITFAKPYALKAGETIKVNYPASVNCPTGSCEGGTCTLAVGWVRLVKKANSNTGDLFTDYEFAAYKWGASYTASEDCLVVAMVKYNKHGSTAFNLSLAYMKEIYVTVTPKE